jgi:polyphosphate kinase
VRETEISNTHDQTSLLNVASKLGVLREETITWMDHVDAVIKGNLDDLIARQVCTDRGVLASLSDNVRLIGLYERVLAHESSSVKC